VLWGLGFPLAAASALVARLWNQQTLELSAADILLLILVCIWAFRLSYYVGLRYYRKGREDVRYNNWRKQWGKTWLWRSYLQVFVLQPLILILIALPIMKTVDVAPRNFSVLYFVGIGIWLVGFIFEVVGDHQLKVFTANPANKGRIMDQGLWSWTRHPNYFGEATLWWGIYLMAFEASHWWMVISPITITFLVTKVSGVSMLEALMEGRPGFAEYKKKTSVFFPWPPQTGSSN